MPLKGYAKSDGDLARREQYKQLCPDGLVPAVQLAAAVGFAAPLPAGRHPGSGSGFDVLESLACQFPHKALLPRTPVRKARAAALSSLSVQLECVVGASDFPLQPFTHLVAVQDPESVRWRDDGDGVEQNFGGCLNAGAPLSQSIL